jgi:hypothetical protein
MSEYNTTLTGSSSFWSTLDSLIKRIQTGKFNLNEPQTPTELNSIEKILPRLKCQEPIQTRLKTFEELIKLSELFNFNEDFLNVMLQYTKDMFKIESTAIEFRKVAFELLTQLYLRQVGAK